MNPSMPAFVDEVQLIKLSKDEDTKKEFESELKPMLKTRFLKSAPKYALGAGLGYGTGWLLGEKTRPWLLKNMTPKTRRLAMGAATGLGAIGAVALWDAMRTAAKEEEKAKQDARK